MFHCYATRAYKFDPSQGLKLERNQRMHYKIPHLHSIS